LCPAPASSPQQLVLHAQRFGQWRAQDFRLMHRGYEGAHVLRAGVVCQTVHRLIPPPSGVKALDRAAELFPEWAREGRAHASQDDVEPEPGLQAERQPIQEVRQGQSDFLLPSLRTQVEPQARPEDASRLYHHEWAASG
jgi:hypothetical protein